MLKSDALSKARCAVSAVAAHTAKSDKAPAAGEPKENLLLSLLEAVVKLISLEGGEVGREIVPEICQACGSDPVSWRLLGRLSDAVGKLYHKHSSAFGLVGFRACISELMKASQIIGHRSARGSGSLLDDVDMVVHSMLTFNPPASWVSTLKTLDTTIFLLEYMGKEDLPLAFEKFEAQVKGGPLLDLLNCVKQIYTKPIASMKPSNMPDGDIQGFIKREGGTLEKSVNWREISFKAADW